MSKRDVTEMATTLEAELQKLVSQAMQKEADYGRAVVFVELARKVAKLRTDIAQALNGDFDEPSNLPGRLAVEGESARSRKASGSPYPHYFVENGRLVKIGKGRGRKSEEYRHEVPRDNAQAVIETVNELARNGASFTLPQVIEHANDRFRDYQVYVVSSCLTALGQLKTVSKGSYVLAEHTGNRIDLQALWAQLSNSNKGGLQ